MTTTVRNRLLALGPLGGVLLAGGLLLGPAFGTLANRAVRKGGP